jgi:hypothetical protein
LWKCAIRRVKLALPRLRSWGSFKRKRPNSGGRSKR